MATVHPIVSVGLDLPLLFIRAAVLERAGYEVVSVSPLTPSLPLLLRRQPPLVLICQSVQGSGRADLMREARAAKAPVLVFDRGKVDPDWLLATVAGAIDASVPAPPRSRATGPRLVRHASAVTATQRLPRGQ